MRVSLSSYWHRGGYLTPKGEPSRPRTKTAKAGQLRKISDGIRQHLCPGILQLIPREGIQLSCKGKKKFLLLSK